MVTLVVERDGPIAWLRYGAPANRLTAVGLLRLRRAMDALAADPSVRVVVLAGADGRFPTLMDPADGLAIVDGTPALPRWMLIGAVRLAMAWFRTVPGSRRWLDDERHAVRTAFLNTLLLQDRLEHGGPITIAAIHGPAFGGGLELALCCDLRVASDHPETWLALPEVQAGVMVGFGSSQRLPRLIGPARALEVLLLGEAVDPARALAWGLVNRVLPAEGFDVAVRALAGRLAQRPPAAAAGTRRAVAEGGAWTELREVLAVWRTADARAGLGRVAAMLEAEGTSAPRTLPEWIAELEQQTAGASPAVGRA